MLLRIQCRTRHSIVSSTALHLGENLYLRLPPSLLLAYLYIQVLSQLGVWILDAPALGNQAQNPLVLKYANACSPSGVLSALHEALFPSPPPLQSVSTAAEASGAIEVRRDFGPGGAARRRVDNRFQSVGPAGRDALRKFMSGPQRHNSNAAIAGGAASGGVGRRGLTDQQLELLKGLPIYRVHGNNSDNNGSSSSTGGGQFTSISGAEQPLLLAPRNTDAALLGPLFAVEERGADTELLESLGVQRVGKGAFVREHMLPRAVDRADSVERRGAVERRGSVGRSSDYGEGRGRSWGEADRVEKGSSRVGLTRKRGGRGREVYSRFCGVGNVRDKVIKPDCDSVVKRFFFSVLICGEAKCLRWCKPMIREKHA